MARGENGFPEFPAQKESNFLHKQLSWLTFAHQSLNKLESALSVNAFRKLEDVIV